MKPRPGFQKQLVIQKVENPTNISVPNLIIVASMVANYPSGRCTDRSVSRSLVTYGAGVLDWGAGLVT